MTMRYLKGLHGLFLRYPLISMGYSYVLRIYRKICGPLVGDGLNI